MTNHNKPKSVERADIRSNKALHVEITERKKAEETIKDSERRVRGVLLHF